jgi:hypothetical protein
MPAQAGKIARAGGRRIPRRQALIGARLGVWTLAVGGAFSSPGAAAAPLT